jgi:hypothetical protein
MVVFVAQVLAAGDTALSEAEVPFQMQIQTAQRNKNIQVQPVVCDPQLHSHRIVIPEQSSCSSKYPCTATNRIVLT